MLSRREFIKLSLAATTALGLSNVLIPELAEALTVRNKKPSVIWLEGMTCTGDFLSFINGLNPRIQQMLFDTIEFHFGNTIMSAQGEMAMDVLYKTAEEKKGEFILIVEGTVPLRDKGMWCIVGHYQNKPITNLEILQYLAPKAKHIMAVGTCASFGGPFAAHPNPSRSVPVSKVIKEPVINVPGCPVHPDWAMGTLTHLLLYGVPELDPYRRPVIYFGKNIHDNCPRRYYFEYGKFSTEPGEPWCLFKIGCKGPVTYSDCPTRQWIGYHTNWPIGDNTPCIGCVSPEFPDRMSPFFEHLPDVKPRLFTPTAKKLSFISTGVIVAAIGGHFAVSVAKGRFRKKMINGTSTNNVYIPKENYMQECIEKKDEEFQTELLLKRMDDVLEEQKKINKKIDQIEEGRKSTGIKKKRLGFFKAREKGEDK